MTAISDSVSPERWEAAKVDVPTAPSPDQVVAVSDARVLPGGTAYVTDVGMTGPRGGVIGVRREQALESLITQMPIRFETSDEDPWLMGVVIRCSQPMRADAIEQILLPAPE